MSTFHCSNSSKSPTWLTNKLVLNWSNSSFGSPINFWRNTLDIQFNSFVLFLRWSCSNKFFKLIICPIWKLVMSKNMVLPLSAIPLLNKFVLSNKKFLSESEFFKCSVWLLVTLNIFSEFLMISIKWWQPMNGLEERILS